MQAYDKKTAVKWRYKPSSADRENKWTSNLLSSVHLSFICNNFLPTTEHDVESGCANGSAG